MNKREIFHPYPDRPDIVGYIGKDKDGKPVLKVFRKPVARKQWAELFNLPRIAFNWPYKD